MGILGSGFKDITSAIKDMTLFFAAWTVVCVIAGQWFAKFFPFNSNQWWYPTYLLIVLLVIKIVLDAFTGSGGKKKKK